MFASLLRFRNKDKLDPSGPGQLRLDRLPPELLSLVFAHCRDEERIQGVSTRDKFPLNLAAVCCTWRSIVNNTPALWAKIPRCHLPSTGPRYPALITLFLTCSGALPLDIHVYCGTSEDLSTHPILLMLRSCAERWAVVHLTSTLATLKAFTASISLLPELRSIKLHIWNSFGSDWTIPCFAMSPKLKEVTITGWPLIKAGLDLPWTEILYYSVHGMGDDRVGPFLGDRLPEQHAQTPNAIHHGLFTRPSQHFAFLCPSLR